MEYHAMHMDSSYTQTQCIINYQHFFTSDHPRDNDNPPNICRLTGEFRAYVGVGTNNAKCSSLQLLTSGPWEEFPSDDKGLGEQRLKSSRDLAYYFYE